MMAKVPRTERRDARMDDSFASASDMDLAGMREHRAATIPV
jgi:hypothetical protein